MQWTNQIINVKISIVKSIEYAHDLFDYIVTICLCTGETTTNIWFWKLKSNITIIVVNKIEIERIEILTILQFPWKKIEHRDHIYNNNEQCPIWIGYEAFADLSTTNRTIKSKIEMSILRAYAWNLNFQIYHHLCEFKPFW